MRFLKQSLKEKDLKIEHVSNEHRSKVKLIENLEQKLNGVLEENCDVDGLEVMDMLKREQHEKQILADEIYLLTKQLNELRNLNLKLKNENKQLRFYYKVPEDFGLDFDEDLKTLSVKQSYKGQLEYFKKEVLELEKERTLLREKLRDLSGLLSNNSEGNPLLRELTEDQIHLVQMYSLNLKKGSYEAPLNDISFELKKKCEMLEV